MTWACLLFGCYNIIANWVATCNLQVWLLGCKRGIVLFGSGLQGTLVYETEFEICKLVKT